MIIAIVGPTASGKTDLSIKVAKEFNFSIVNFDVFQSYKELNIGTAKPTPLEFNGVENFLFDKFSVKENITIFNFQKELRKTIDELIKQGKNVLLVGGSGLYLRSAIYDYSFKESLDIEEKDFSSYSNDDLYELLLKIDEASARIIHKNNRRRVERALNVFYTTGILKSDNDSNQEHKLIYDMKIFGIDLDRSVLNDRINLRVDLMVKNGLLNEIKYIEENNLSEYHALKAIGYKEFFMSLSLEETLDLIKKNTRHYAKRQMTFFKNKFDQIIWGNTAELVYNRIKEYLGG